LDATFPGLLATFPGLLATFPGLLATIPGLLATIPGLLATIPGLDSGFPAGMTLEGAGLPVGEVSPPTSTTTPTLQYPNASGCSSLLRTASSVGIRPSVLTFSSTCSTLSGC
jgi:hypothetical protein